MRHARIDPDNPVAGGFQINAAAGAAEGAGGQFGHHALTLAAVLAVAGGGFMAAQASLELWLNAIN
jgi:hypothetical protein